MKSRCALLALSALPIALQGQAAPSPARPVPATRILIHVSSANSADWDAALVRAQEYLSTGQPALVEILATGDGLKLVDKANAMSPKVSASLNKDVSFVACHNSMKSNGMGIDQLDTGVGTVPSGGVEITQRRQTGWTILDDASLSKPAGAKSLPQ